MKDFYYAINALSQEEKAILNNKRTLEEIRDDRLLLQKKALEEIPEGQLPAWLLIEQSGIRGCQLYDVYIALKLTWILTATGKRRRINRALKMAGVPFVKVKRMDEGYLVADDGFYDVVLIAKLEEGKNDQRRNLGNGTREDT